ncbi:MAG TPA: hypothetical protein VED01_16715 [Burkholderiales bacterium]|nr:hypothetical protein [Burkholderiales bacterium]
MRAIAILSSLLLSLPAFAGFPSGYKHVSLDQALAAAAKDGKPVMIFFTAEN